MHTERCGLLQTLCKQQNPFNGMKTPTGVFNEVSSASKAACSAAKQQKLDLRAGNCSGETLAGQDLKKLLLLDKL